MRKAVVRVALFGSAAFLVVSAGPKEASAGAFGVREQSAYFLGTSFAGSAAGDDISSMFWNSAATAAKSGCNASSNITALFGHEKETAQAGLLVTGLSPTETDVGRSGVVPSSYTTCQLTDRLYVGLGVNAPFGLITKPDATSWAGSPLGTTSKIFSTDINPTIAFKLTPQLTVGAGVQIEYFSIDLAHGGVPSAVGNLIPTRSYDADGWGAGATVGLLWQPSRATSIGIGYRSQVDLDVSGNYTRSPFVVLPPPALTMVPGVSTKATASLTLPNEVTLSARQSLTSQFAVLATIEWQNWSSLGNVAATSAGCGAAGVCEVLNLNYRDGWFYAIGAEYALSRALTLRTGIAYETSPIRDSNRDILLPDSNRIHLSVGGSYKVTDTVTVDLGYSHLFFEDGTFCIANPTMNGGTTHCNAGTPASAVLLTGKSDASADLVALGLKYKF